MSLLSVLLQEPEIREASTILALLSDQMEGVDSSRRRSRRTSLKERLGLKGLGCCGTTWGFSPTTIVTNDDPDTDEEQEEREAVVNTGQEERDSDPGCLDPNPSPNQQHSSGMNLAAALAAERQLREAGSNIMEPASVIDVGNTSVGSTGTPVRVSLMRLLEESTEGGGGGGGGEVVITETTGGGVGNDTVCCVCMGRKKGAAFIPCGHTFCRVCSRELWLNRGSCPLCNRSILEILDIF
ncbi:hypothetical protein SADUNF_Sadunf04G0002100 [Salix dunnii]|uniref:RING-type domain-containing protein n=1 Tax=Salix dunnii TaxID=1413687 RepID=A0A835K7A1_9ROSI|nr:hypothetical protein SADUNF_Sadunf04G0002100 [Salix dunnii]